MKIIDTIKHFQKPAIHLVVTVYNQSIISFSDVIDECKSVLDFNQFRILKESKHDTDLTYRIKLADDVCTGPILIEIIGSATSLQDQIFCAINDIQCRTTDEMKTTLHNLLD